MKITTLQAINGYTWGVKSKDSDRSFTASYLIAANIQILEPFVKSYDESRQAIIDKYGVKDDEGNITFENQEVVDEEFSKLLATEIDANINPIPLSEMGTELIPVNLMSLISFMFKL